MLVNVYGSKELFVNEYRTLLADRILSQFSYNTDKEIRYLELLKLRWSMPSILFCCEEVENDQNTYIYNVCMYLWALLLHYCFMCCYVCLWTLMNVV
jgi:hypothetical protein